MTPLSHRLTGTALSSRMPVRRSSHSAYEDSHALATVYCSYSSCIHCDLIHYYENFSSCRTMNSPQHTTQPTPVRLSSRLTCSTREGRGFASGHRTTIWRRRCTTCLLLHVPYSSSSPASREDAPQR